MYCVMYSAMINGHFSLDKDNWTWGKLSKKKQQNILKWFNITVGITYSGW